MRRSIILLSYASSTMAPHLGLSIVSSGEKAAKKGKNASLLF
jgi:hypothetical protein